MSVTVLVIFAVLSIVIVPVVVVRHPTSVSASPSLVVIEVPDLAGIEGALASEGVIPRLVAPTVAHRPPGHALGAGHRLGASALEIPGELGLIRNGPWGTR